MGTRSNTDGHVVNTDGHVVNTDGHVVNTDGHVRWLTFASSPQLSCVFGVRRWHVEEEGRSERGSE
eukprot:3303713-Rhodomonas_salina.1